MAVSKANQRAVNKYVKANYDRINVTMPKGRKDEIKDHAAAVGESVNSYINGAITQRMEAETPSVEDSAGVARDPQEAVEAGVVSLPNDTIKTAQEAAGEAET